MWIDSFQLKNIRGFIDSSSIKLSKNITLLVGPNNSGKSTLIKALYLLQNGSALLPIDLRANTANGRVEICSCLSRHIDPSKYDNSSVRPADIKDYAFAFTPGGVSRSTTGSSATQNGAASFFPQTEPDNVIYPFLSRRKVGGLAEQVSRAQSDAVPDNLQNLTAKIDRLSNPHYPKYEEFIAACKSILGFSVSCSPSLSGKEAGIIVDTNRYISLNSMGEGVINLLGIIVSLCIADGRIFLVEELEKDIHPTALKGLLELILHKAESNQFVVSTHSNIVVKYLGSHPAAMIYHVTSSIDAQIPTSALDCVDNTPSERFRILQDLGYDLSDFGMASAWLFFEESTCERIVRDFLVPWFAPSLRGKLRTFSARCVNEVEAKFTAFDRLYVYAHLEPSYKNRAWVLVDGCDAGKAVVKTLREKYTPLGWHDNRFQFMSVTDLEHLYPAEFKEQVANVLAMPSSSKRDAKQRLFDDVLKWIQQDESRAKTAFHISAGEIVSLLKTIEQSC